MNVCSDLLKSKVDLIFKIFDEYVQMCNYIKQQQKITKRDHKEKNLIAVLNANKKEEQKDLPKISSE